MTIINFKTVIRSPHIFEVIVAYGIVHFFSIYQIFYIFNEGINTKTWISLALSLILILIQVFWKVK